MKSFLSLLLVTLSLLSCSKQNGGRVEIYMLSSFQFKIDTSTYPSTTSVINPVLERTPLVSDAEIIYYKAAEHSFMLGRDIKSSIINYGANKAFAVVVDGEPVYYGKFHPAYLSSISLGIALIDPIMIRDGNLKIGFVEFTGAGWLAGMDKRNDQRLLSALAASGRLK